MFVSLSYGSYCRVFYHYIWSVLWNIILIIIRFIKVDILSLSYGSWYLWFNTWDDIYVVQGSFIIWRLTSDVIVNLVWMSPLYSGQIALPEQTQPFMDTLSCWTNKPTQGFKPICSFATRGMMPVVKSIVIP